MYHMQRNEGNMIVNMDRAWDEIGYFQIGDNPEEMNPHRRSELKNIFSHMASKGYKGILLHGALKRQAG
jgi:hydroxypyruvate isomerase